MKGFVDPLHLVPKFLLRATVPVVVVLGSGTNPSEGVIRNARNKANDFMTNCAVLFLF